MLRSALEQFKKEKQVQAEVSAHTTLAETYLELRRLTEAKAELTEATKLAGKNEGYKIRLKMEIVVAEVLSATGEPGDAARNLRRTIKDAQNTGFFLLQLEASLALAEAEAKSGKKREGRALLESVKKNARSKGFLLIARRAVIDRG